jgi:CRP-like cAMP-binding protein
MLRTDTFSSYLTSYGPFTDVELARIAAVASPRKLKRHELLLQASEVCRAQAVVVSGLLRLYRVGGGNRADYALYSYDLVDV